MMVRYLTQLSVGMTILWCYAIWYLLVVMWYFDPSWRLWMNAAGMSAIIGCALCLSVRGRERSPLQRWQIARLFIMPWCVSSFAALTKGRDFILIVPPHWQQCGFMVGSCVLFVCIVQMVKRWNRVRALTVVSTPA